MAVIADLKKVMEFASSGQAQGLMEAFTKELDEVKKDRIGFKAAVPIMFAKYDARLDAIEKKMDAVIALLMAGGNVTSPENPTNERHTNNGTGKPADPTGTG